MTLIRTRYAYTPRRYSYLDHVRHLRLALFNWCLARSDDGQMIVRDEDIDGDPLELGTLETLRWLGLTWDEGPDVGGPYAPYVQSERFGVYSEIVQQLVQSGKAYYCDCSPERLAELHKSRRDYDNHCRNLHVQPGPRTVIRLIMPDQGKTVITDTLRGAITFENAKYTDPVIVKEDSEPTSYLTSVVDDHHMEITHVLREDNLLPSLPISVALYSALDWTPPQFVHLPPIWDRSAEHSELHSISVLREQGYLPNAVFNYLAFLGWNPETNDEILTPDEIAEHFSLDRMTVGSIEFDVKKLNWFNQQHMQRLSLEYLLELSVPRLLETYPDHELLRDPAWAGTLIDTVREQIATLDDILPATRFAFVDPIDDSPKALSELNRETSTLVLSSMRDGLPAEGDISMETAEDLLKELRKDFKQSHELSSMQVILPIRVALTGTTEGPHLPSIIALLGAETCCRRIDQALQQLTVSGS